MTAWGNKRKIKLEGINKEVVLSKSTGLKIKKHLWHLDELDDGTYRIQYNNEMIPDHTKLKSIDFDGDKISFRGLGIHSTISKRSSIAAKKPTLQLEYDDKTETWKLLYDRTFVPDITKLTSLVMVRES